MYSNFFLSNCSSFSGPGFANSMFFNFESRCAGNLLKREGICQDLDWTLKLSLKRLEAEYPASFVQYYNILFCLVFSARKVRRKTFTQILILL